jgi:hypothetical protein
MPQFLHHPLPVEAVFFRVMQNMDLPEGKQKFPLDRVSHERAGYRMRKIDRQ